VKWTLPSAESAEGATVAAFAVHIADALQVRAKRTNSSFAAFAITSASLPVKPRARSVGRCGRSWGGRNPCGSPRPARNAAFASPCFTASRGAETLPSFAVLATLPKERPA
jgi:hypothetical protein